MKNNEETKVDQKLYLTSSQKIYQENAYLTLLHETALSLMNRLSLEELLKDIVQSACDIMDTTHGFVYLLNSEIDMLEVKVGLGAYHQYVGAYREKGKALSGMIWKTAEPLAIEDYHSWKGRAKKHERPHGWDIIKSVMGAPLKSGSDVIGIIGLGFDKMQKFSQFNIDHLTRFAALASIALDNARLYTALNEELAERRRRKEELEQSISLIKATLESTADGILVVEKTGKITTYNQKFIDIWQIPRKVLDAGDYQALDYVKDKLHDPEEFVKRVMHLYNKSENSYDLLKFKDGRIIERYSQPQRIGKAIVGRVFSFRDITAKKRYEEELKRLSIYDTLTGVYNRNYIEKEMGRISQGVQVSIIVCDLDGLKLTNDILGHNVGDQLILAAANVVRSCIRCNDVLARMGGDEFAILLPNTPEDVAEGICRIIQAAIEDYNKSDRLVTLSISVGVATSNGILNISELYKEADNNMYREKLLRKSSTRKAFIQTLKKALEARDFITDGHVERLQRTLVKMATAIGLSNRQISDICLFAQFHDIGKVGVPERILFKNVELSYKEKEEVKRHCEIGYSIAQADSDLAHIAEWILYHQEWWNGKGYPVGLKGEEIPLECRLLAIADAFDAMSNDRPYRKAMSHLEALEEIKKCSGSQFDPQLVTLFLKVQGYL